MSKTSLAILITKPHEDKGASPANFMLNILILKCDVIDRNIASVKGEHMRTSTPGQFSHLCYRKQFSNRTIECFFKESASSEKITRSIQVYISESALRSQKCTNFSICKFCGSCNRRLTTTE